MRTEERDTVRKSSTGKHSLHSVAEGSGVKEQNLSVAHCDGRFCFVLYFLLSSSTKPSSHNNTDVGLHLSSTAVCSFWSLLVIKKLMEMRELRVKVDRTLKDQFHSGLCSSHLTVGKEN